MLDALERGNAHAPPVLLLHGQVLGNEIWSALAERLAPARRLLVPNAPGYGRSPLPEPFSFEAVHQAFEEYAVSRSAREVDVVGWSMGSYHALALALRGRLKVRKLVLIGAVAGLDEPARAGFGALGKQIASGATEPLRTMFQQICFSEPFQRAHPEAVAHLQKQMEGAPWNALRLEMECISQMPDLRSRLAEVRASTLLICGTNDPSTPLALSEEIAREIPGAKLERIEGANHHVLVEARERTLELVGGHL